jgi:hypothetical protein
VTGKNSDPAAGKGAAGDDDKTKGAPAGPDKGGDEDLQAELDKWKALARQHETLWKSTGLTKDDLPEAKALLAKAREADDKSKTADDRIAALEKKIAEADANATRLEIAAEKGLTPAMARRLVGTTREELEADADELVKFVKPAEGDGKGAAAVAGAGGGAADGRARPREALRSGTAPQAEPEENDPTKLAALIPRG